MNKNGGNLPLGQGTQREYQNPEGGSDPVYRMHVKNNHNVFMYMFNGGPPPAVQGFPGAHPAAGFFPQAAVTSPPPGYSVSQSSIGMGGFGQGQFQYPTTSGSLELRQAGPGMAPFTPFQPQPQPSQLPWNNGGVGGTWNPSAGSSAQFQQQQRPLLLILPPKVAQDLIRNNLQESQPSSTMQDRNDVPCTSSGIGGSRAGFSPSPLPGSTANLGTGDTTTSNLQKVAGSIGSGSAQPPTLSSLQLQGALGKDFDKSVYRSRPSWPSSDSSASFPSPSSD